MKAEYIMDIPSMQNALVKSWWLVITLLVSLLLLPLMLASLAWTSAQTKNLVTAYLYSGSFKL